MVTSRPKWLQPEFAGFFLTLNMNVRRLGAVEAREEESVRPRNAFNAWHSTSLQKISPKSGIMPSTLKRNIVGMQCFGLKIVPARSRGHYCRRPGPVNPNVCYCDIVESESRCVCVGSVIRLGI